MSIFNGFRWKSLRIENIRVGEVLRIIMNRTHRQHNVGALIDGVICTGHFVVFVADTDENVPRRILTKWFINNLSTPLHGHNWFVSYLAVMFFEHFFNFHTCSVLKFLIQCKLIKGVGEGGGGCLEASKEENDWRLMKVFLYKGFICEMGLRFWRFVEDYEIGLLEESFECFHGKLVKISIETFLKFQQNFLRIFMKKCF